MVTACRTWSEKAIKKVLFSQEVQKGIHCILDSFLRGVLVCVDPDFVPGFVNYIYLKDYMSTISLFCHLAKISKFSVNC